MSNLEKNPSESQEMKVTAVMTMGRWAAVDPICRIMNVLAYFGIPLCRSQGVFWGQNMERNIEDVLKQGTTHLLFIDWDSLFAVGHLERLIRVMATYPSIDAVCPMQVKRGCKETLVSSLIPGNPLEIANLSPVQIKTGHFGLTIIKAECFAKIAKPWFWSTPDPEKTWDREGSKIDDDIYFWLRFEEAGNKLYLDPGTRIGHLEEMVTVHDENLQPVTMYPSEWLESVKNQMESKFVRPKGEDDDTQPTDDGRTIVGSDSANASAS